MQRKSSPRQLKAKAVESRVEVAVRLSDMNAGQE